MRVFPEVPNEAILFCRMQTYDLVNSWWHIIILTVRERERSGRNVSYSSTDLRIQPASYAT